MLNKQIEQLQAQIDSLNEQISLKQDEIKKAQKEVNSFEYTMSESDFDEILDCEGLQQTSVGSFYPSDILKYCDPVAYRCAKSDYEACYDLDECEEYQDLVQAVEDLENELSDLEEELNNLENELSDLENDE